LVKIVDSGKPWKGRAGVVVAEMMVVVLSLALSLRVE
jgi:hypothetical protein